jgi:hypothetical protein
MGKLGLITIIHKNKIRFGFRTTCIWPLNPKAIDNKIRPSKVYIATNLNNGRNEKDYIIEDEVKNNPQWGEGFVIIKLMHAIETN